MLVLVSIPVLAWTCLRRDRKLRNQILAVLLRYDEMCGLQIIDTVYFPALNDGALRRYVNWI